MNNRKKHNGAGNIYTGRAYVKQTINIYNNPSNGTSNNSYVPPDKIRQIDQMIEELTVIEGVLFKHNKEEVIKKHRWYIKENFGNGAYTKLSIEGYEKAKQYLLRELYSHQERFAEEFYKLIKELKPEQQVKLYKKYMEIVKK